LEDVFKKDRSSALSIAGCHALAYTDGAIVGDPLERQCFEGIGFKLAEDGSRTTMGPNGTKVIQMKKYLFNSSLKRMSVMC